MAATTIISMTQNDTAPPRTFIVEDFDGSAVNVTGTTVKFKIKDDQTGTVTNAAHQPCTLVTPTAGVVKYVWVTGDLPSAGTYTCELEVTYADATTRTIPNIIIVASAEVA